MLHHDADVRDARRRLVRRRGQRSVADRDTVRHALVERRRRQYTRGYDVIEHRDLETRYLYHPASTAVRGVDVAMLLD